MASFPQPSGAQPVRPPVVGSTGIHQNFVPPMPVQFMTGGPPQQSHHFIPPPSQQFQPVQGMVSSFAGMPPVPPQFPPPVHPIIPRPSHTGQSPVPSQLMPAPYIQSNSSISPGLMQCQHNPPFQTSHLVNPGGGGMPLSSAYTFSTSYDQQSNNVNVNVSSQYQSIPQLGPPVLPSASQLPASSSVFSAPTLSGLHSHQVTQPSSSGSVVVSATVAPSVPSQQSSDWQEHACSNGKRYYYNKKTKHSSWQKPVELMTPIERADASTPWKEYSSSDGRKYYYHKITKESTWTIPEDLKFAREQAEKTGIQSAQLETGAISLPSVALAAPSLQIPSPSIETSNFNSPAMPAVGPSITVTSTSLATSTVNSTTCSASRNQVDMVASGSPPIAALSSTSALSNSSLGTTDATSMLNATTPMTPLPASSPANSVLVEDTIERAAKKISNENFSDENVIHEKSQQSLEEAKRDATYTEKNNLIALEEKPTVEEPLVYANKQDAKNAFKSLLESTNIESDWPWERAMRVIINDKRYLALKTLGEKKQVFNEFLDERKKQEIEKRHVKQKKASEDFVKMLEESKELSSSTRWRKAEAIFEGDERYNAVEAKDRRDLFESYMDELRKKEKVKAAEEYKRNTMEYRTFLESCDFIKVSSQWRKVKDRLEIDDRCSRLDKFERLKIFQDYINDLEKEEEEKQKIQKELSRKAERKNRDDFRKLMEEHVAGGILTAKTHWRDYHAEVKDLPSYMAVSLNTSGATPKDLFEDVTEELEKQYLEDKTRIKDAVKMGKIALTSSSTFESFKADTLEDNDLQTISEINLKLIFKDILEKLRDREEKEAKRRQRLADSFSNLLYSSREISASSTWEECKLLFADCQQFSPGSEESFLREIFDKYVTHLQEKAQEKERKKEEEKAKKDKGREDREKRKERKEREREKENGRRRSRKDETETENVGVVDICGLDEKSRAKDKDRKHRKHRRSTEDEVEKDDKEEKYKSHKHSTEDEVEKDEKGKSKKAWRHSTEDEAEKDEKEKSKRSHRHTSARKRSRKRSSESEDENRHRKHRKDRGVSRRNSSHDDLEDGELGDDGQVS